MKKWLIVWIILAVLSAAACGGKSKKTVDTAQQEPEPPPPAKKSKPVENRFLIENVTFMPEKDPTVLTDITAVPKLKTEEPGVDFRFRWFVNRQEIDNETGPMLSHTYFKKNDMINCIVTGEIGTRSTPDFYTNFIRIIDSPPVIEEKPVDNFNVPGIFRYQIKASDADEDTLTYTLISPTDLDIEIDSKKGLITWDLNAGTVSGLSEVVEIRFKVSDDEMETEGFIRLNFTRVR